jgi:predicted nucleic acid-binding protein
MPLHYFSNLLMSECLPQEPKTSSNNILEELGMEIDLGKYEKYIRSTHLINILKSNERIVKVLFDVASKFIRVAQQQ